MGDEWTRPAPASGADEVAALLERLNQVEHLAAEIGLLDTASRAASVRLLVERLLCAQDATPVLPARR